MNNQTNCSVIEKDEPKNKTFEVRFDGFADLPTRKADYNCVESPQFTCFGHQWLLRLHPGGDSRSADGKVAVYLLHMSDESIEIECKLIVEEGPNTAAFVKFLNSYTYKTYAGRGKFNFAEHSKLISALKDGCLIIRVEMRSSGPADTTSFIPENPLCKSIFKLFNDDKSSDIVFEISCGEVKNAQNKRAETSTAFHAHRLILERCAPLLAEFCGESSLVAISDVNPDIFSLLLGYIYGEKVKEQDFKSYAKSIIDAADRFGVVGLKLETEAWLVKSNTINIENMMDNLLYAESKNCALLKESVMDFIIENSVEVAKKVALNEVPPGLFADLLTAMNREKQKDAVGSNGEDLSTMRVDDLRRKLNEKGLDVDGSREMMIARLEGADGA